MMTLMTPHTHLYNPPSLSSTGFPEISSLLDCASVSISHWMKALWWQFGYFPIQSQEMASSRYLSTIARGLSWDSTCRSVGVSLAPSFYLIPNTPHSMTSLLLLSPSIHPSQLNPSSSQPHWPSVYLWDLLYFPFPVKSIHLRCPPPLDLPCYLVSLDCSMVIFYNWYPPISEYIPSLSFWDWVT